MKYNSIHKFADWKDAESFVEAIAKAGFKHIEYSKDGGALYSNGLHSLFVVIGKI